MGIVGWGMKYITLTAKHHEGFALSETFAQLVRFLSFV